MRPVNLIPAEDRRGENAPLRTGPLVYVLIGALVAVLAGVTALVLTSNQISDHEAEIAKLEREDAAAQARVQRLAPYAQFATLTEERVSTVSSLADSRFDWERVMRELSLVLPHDVWLVSLTGSAAPGISTGDSASGGSSSSSSDLRSATPGPALEIAGCAKGQDGVAGFVTALKDIEGVTRVGVESSQLPEPAGAPSAVATGEGSGGSSNDDCRTRESIAKFEIVVAFDAAPVTGTSAAPVAPPEEGESAPTSSEGTEAE